MRWLAVLSLALTGCGRYADFGLPAPPASETFALTWKAAPAASLTRGDALDVLNPSVAFWRGGYLNLYSRFDGGKWESYSALSPDGLVWRDHTRVLSPSLDWEGKYIAANGALWVNAPDDLLYVYQAGEKGKTVLGLARSADGRTWQKQPGPILAGGPRKSWDEISLGDPYLWRAGEYLYLAYLGEDRARRQRLGLARSRDGLTWEKQRGSPILELGGYGDFDENGLGEPAVFAANGAWMMLYTGRDRNERRAMGYAVSRDGRSWQKLREPVLRGESPWNRAVVCDATVRVEKGRVRIWYGGGDLPKPDERLNGQIGYAELQPRVLQPRVIE